MHALKIIAAAALVALPAAGSADAVTDAVLAASAKAPMVAFERSARITQGTGSERKTFVRVDRFNPRAAEGKQWTLVSIDGRAPTDDERSAHADNVRDNPVPGFHRLHIMLAGTPQLKSDAGGRKTYFWPNLQKNALPAPGPDFSAKLSAEAVVEQVGGQPMMTRVRVFAAKPFSIMAVAKMNRFDVVSNYGPGAAGVPFLASQTSNSDVNAPMGRGGVTSSQMSFKPL